MERSSGFHHIPVISGSESRLCSIFFFLSMDSHSVLRSHRLKCDKGIYEKIIRAYDALRSYLGRGESSPTTARVQEHAFDKATKLVSILRTGKQRVVSIFF